MPGAKLFECVLIFHVNAEGCGRLISSAGVNELLKWEMIFAICRVAVVIDWVHFFLLQMTVDISVPSAWWNNNDACRLRATALDWIGCLVINGKRATIGYSFWTDNADNCNTWCQHIIALPLSNNWKMSDLKRPHYKQKNRRLLDEKKWCAFLSRYYPKRRLKPLYGSLCTSSTISHCIVYFFIIVYNWKLQLDKWKTVFMTMRWAVFSYFFTKQAFLPSSTATQSTLVLQKANKTKQFYCTNEWKRCAVQLRCSTHHSEQNERLVRMNTHFHFIFKSANFFWHNHKHKYLSYIF